MTRKQSEILMTLVYLLV